MNITNCVHGALITRGCEEMLPLRSDHPKVEKCPASRSDLNTTENNWCVAQLVERLPVKQDVASSSLAVPVVYPVHYVIYILWIDLITIPICDENVTVRNVVLCDAGFPLSDISDSGNISRDGEVR